MRILFWGTGEFAVPALNAISKSGYDIVGVVTQPDRPSGRGRKAIISPVKQAAIDKKLTIYQPEKVRSPDFVDLVRRISPDLSIVASFGQIIPQSILDIPKLGNINIHGSLLPKYRGAAPIHYALFNGDEITGVTTMLMDAGLDTGPILLSEEVPIGESDDRGSLEAKLASTGAELIIKTIDGLVNGNLSPIPQDDTKATYAPSISKDECKIDWSKPAQEIVNKIRGLSPKPGAYTILTDGTILKIWKAEAIEGQGNLNYGSVYRVSPSGIAISAGNGTVLLREIQPENRKRMTASEYARGYKIEEGMAFRS